MSRKDLPNEKAPNFNARLRETMMTYLGKSGDPLDRGITLRDLVDSGIVDIKDLRAATYGGALPLEPGTAVTTAPDLTPPPSPEGFTATAGVAGIILEHAQPIFTQGRGYYRTHIYGATRAAGDPAPVFADATEITSFVGIIGSYATDPATVWHLWAKWESADGILSTSPAGGTNGVVATTGEDVSTLLDALTSELDGSGNPVNPNTLLIQRATTTTINGVTVPAGVYMKDAYVQNGTITNAKIANAAIDNAKVLDINASKITAGYIDAARIQAATITADKLGAGQISASGDITVGGTGSSAPLVLSPNGEIVSNGSGGDKARLYSGNVEIYKQVPSVGQVVYKALSRAEFGQATNNTTVTIPGYFKSQPKIIVSPADLQLYSTSYSGQNQSIQCQAQTITETSSGSMVWTFKPVATLSLAANTGNTVINQASGNQTSSWYSSQYTTQANTNTITPSVYLTSNRGNGSNQYYYRTVRWRVEYWNGSSWVAGSFTTSNLSGSTTASVTSTATFTFPSSGTWTFRIYCEAYDTDGSVFGSVSYNYASGTIAAAGPASVQNYQLGTYSTSLTMTGYSVPSGYSVYSVDYAVDWSWSRNGTNGSVTVEGTVVKLASNTNTSGSGTRTWNSGSLDPTINLDMTITALGAGFGGENIYSQISNARATVYSRQLVTNSTTASNNFQFNSYAFTLTASQVLATGSLNWVALGD